MIAIDQALSDNKLLGAALGPAETWRTWLTVLRAAYGMPVCTELFGKVAGDRKPLTQPVQELWCVVGRRGGKSRMAAGLATYIAAFVDHSGKLAPGETGFVLALSRTREQARLVFSYCLAFLERSPILRQKIESTTANEIRLQGNIVIAVYASDYRSVRGPTLLACVFDESAYWKDETSTNPDVEVYRAVAPALVTTDGMLVGISSPYRRVGLLHQKHHDHFGRDDPDVLVVQGPSRLFNPTLSAVRIERARASDPEAARAEWDAEFRSDLSQFLDDASIDAAIAHNRPLELPPQPDLRYHVFVDASAGRHDAFTLCVGHKTDDAFVADVVRGRRPPFNPQEVAKEYAALTKEYRCRTIIGDAFAGEWVAQAFRAAGVEYRKSRLVKSAIYLEALPHFARGAVSIPNHPQLIRELRLLERRTHRSGKDTVDHSAGGSDDYANVVCGALQATIDATRFADPNFEGLGGPFPAAEIIRAHDGSGRCLEH